MSGPTSYRLSQETYGLLVENRDFYKSLRDLQDKKEVPIRPKATGDDARTEAKVRDNGDVEISVILPADSNDDASDGRIFIKDTFVFDPSESVLKDYKRSFDRNDKGGDEWKGWLAKYQAVADGENRKISDPEVQKFAQIVAKTYSHAVTDDSANTLPAIRDAFTKEGKILSTTNKMVLDLDQGLKLKIKDKLNYYNFVKRNGNLEVTLQLAVDDDADAANGRILVRDKFTLDANTLEFKGLQRTWSLAPEAAKDEKYTAALKKLQGQPDPTSEEAKAFITNLLPALLPQGEPDLAPALSLMGAAPKLPSDYRSRFARGQGVDPAALKTASQFSLEAMYVVAQEQAMKRYEESQGWAHFGKVDQAAEKSAIDGIFQKAKEAFQKNPGLDPFALLQKLSLEAGEKPMLDKILGDSVMAELNDLASEPDAALRGKSLANLAENRMLLAGGLAQSAVFLANELKKDPATQAAAENVLAIAEGRGNFGQKAGYVLPLFAKEVSKPSMLLGMAAAPFMGTAFELGGLKLAKYAWDAKKISDLGKGVRFGAAVLGMTGEALGFTAIHRGFERLDHSSETAWKGMGGEVLSSVLLFGGMRLTHGGTSWLSARAAEGRFGKFFGARFGESEFAGTIGQTPRGRFMFGDFAPAAGKGIPTLTTTGKIATGLANHAGGILTMQASGALSRAIGLSPASNQSFGANFFDATVMYTQAMVGSHAANIMSGGSLNSTLGKFKMAVENLKGGIPATPPVPQGDPNAAKPPAPEAAKPGEAGPSAPQPSATPEPVKAVESAKASVEPKAPKPRLLDLLLGAKKGGWRDALRGAREWLGNLSPAKVKALQAELAALKQAHAEVTQQHQEKSDAFAALEQTFATLKTEKEAATQEVAAKTQELEATKTKLGETEAARDEAKRDLETKTADLAKKEEEFQALEAKKKEAEQKLGNYLEQAEISEIGLEFGSLQEQLNARKAELGKLRVEKEAAEVKAGALERQEQELRGKLEQANHELERRKGYEKALTEQEQQYSKLQKEAKQTQESLEALGREMAALHETHKGAVRLTADQARQITELTEKATKLDADLKAKTEEYATLRATLTEREQELKATEAKLEDNEAELRTAKFQVDQKGAAVETLEKVKKALERDKEELEGKLNGSEQANSEVQNKLSEAEEKLKQVNRELAETKHDLQIKTSARDSFEKEAGRLRDRLEELGNLKRQKETELNETVRGLQDTLKEKGKEIEKVQGEAKLLADSLAQEGELRRQAEAQVTDLTQQQAELQKTHEKTLADLAVKERRVATLERDIEGKGREIDRQKRSIDELTTRLGGLRDKKGELETSLRETRVEIESLKKELEATKRDLAAEKAKEPEVVRDLNTEMELEEKIEELTAQHQAATERAATLEQLNTELEDRVKGLEAAKQEVEKKLRTTEGELENTKDAEKSVREDLAGLQERSSKEIAGLKTGLDGWRKRYEETEAARALLEAKSKKLESEGSAAKGRADELAKTLAARSSELEKAEKAKKALEGAVAELETQLGGLRGNLTEKTEELNRAKEDLGKKISELDREKASLEAEVAQKADAIQKLHGDLETEQGKVAAIEKKLKETQGLAETTKKQLEAEKGDLAQKIAGKEAEVRRKDSELVNANARIEELETEVATAKTEFEKIRAGLEAEKGSLESKVSDAEKKLGDTKEELASSQQETKRVSDRLEEVSRDLAKEKREVTRLSRELTELRARSEAEIGKLKKDVEDWRGREQSASAAVQAKTDEIATLEAGLTELKRLKEEAEASLGDKLKGAEAEKTRQSERAAEAIRALETLKAETTAEAEQLRQEASQSNIAAKAAEARIQEIEAILETNKAQLESLRADLTAAREKVEALEAPASRSGEAESRARQAQQHAESLRESLAATEAREKAAKEKVQSLESELEALRASSEAEAETLRTQSAAHAERAKAETARAEAAELRVSQLETQHREQELQIAALRSDASTREQIDAELKELRASKESVAGMIREAEDRAVAAERKANGYESQLTEANGQKEEIERELETLKKDKQVVDAELAEREKKLGGLEEQLRQAGAKRRDAEQKSLGLESRVDELEKQAEVRKAELAQKTRELEEAKKKVGEVWNESQEAGKAAKARIEQLEQELAELRNISEGHEEQVRIERQNAADLQNTLEYMQEGELALKTEIDTLKGERNAANTRAQDLAQVIGRSEALLQSLEASLENQQPMGFRGPHSGFTNENPRSEPVNHYIQATALLGNAQGEVKGEAHIVAGGAQGPARLKFADGSRLVGKTTIGNGNRKTQEDSIYMARFELPNGVEVKIKAWADGMGGMGDPGTGAIASSAFLQGVHAAVTEILREGRVPTPEELYQAGNLAMQFQRSRADLNPPIKGPKGAADGSAAGGIMVTVGNEAMIVTAGDATVFHARPDGEGNYEILGYSNVDVIPVPNGSGGFAYNNVTKGFHQDMGRLYHISGLKPGDRIILGSDGLWENLLGTSYKEHGSEEARMVFQFKPPTQKIYLPLLQALRATRGRWDAADLMHDQLAIANIHHPGQKVNFLGEQIQLPATADRDNVLVMDYEHGNAPDVEVTIPVHYNPLEKVPTLEEIRAAEAAAAASTTKGLKHTAPPSTDPKVARPSDPQRVAANFYVDYYRDLAALYGANAEIPARDFVEIFFRFPEVKEVLNPSLLARAEDKQQQKGLFDAAEKKIQEKMNEDPQGAQLALQQLKKIAEVQRPVVAPDPTKVGEFLTRYQEVLVRTFGEEAAPMAAKYFETIFANFPSLEAEIGPAALAKFNPADAASKYFSSKMRFAVHPDRNRYNEKEASDTATKAVGELVALHKSNSAQEFRAANGWTTADAVENGTRTWILDPRAAFVGGKQVPPRTDPNEAPRPLLRMEHNTVSRKHFKLQFENGRWVLENLNSTYGTYVNGQQVQKQALKDGDVLRFGIFEVTFSMDPKTKSAVLQEPAEKAPILPSEPEVSGDLRSGNLTLRLTPGIPIIFGQKEIPDRRVSGQHVELMHNSRTWLIRDMGSEQGTQLNGVDIQAPVNPASRRRGPGIFKDLQNQSYVTIGGLMFRFIEFPNKTATLSYVAGDAAPPSSVSRQVTPPPSIYRLPLVQGQNYPFRSPQGDTVAEIWWEGFAQPGEGEFNLRGINGGGQVWILNQQGVGEALGSNTYALSNGASFGLGSNPAEAQWYVYNDGLITALQQRPMRSRAATEPMGGVRLNIPPTAQPRPVGRAELGGGNDISGHHLDFAVQNGVWLVRDAGTTNGTFLNGQSIGKGKGLVGDPKPLKGNDQLRTGSLILHVSLGLDGSLNLEAVDQIEPQRESPVPISPVPFSRDNGYRAPEIRGSDLLTGWLRNLRIVEARRETGLTSDTPESGNYAVNIRQPKGMFRGLLKDKELARVERLTEGRYRVYNLDFDTPMLITNERGRKLVVSKGGNEYAEIGDQLSFDGHTLVLKP